MTSSELARLCADQIFVEVEWRGPFDDSGALLMRERVIGLIQGAINRALDEQTRSVSEVVHVHGGPGAVDVKVTKSTQGVSLELDCKRPREPGESWTEAAEASALLAAEAYSAALQEIRAIGLIPGKVLPA